MKEQMRRSIGLFLVTSISAAHAADWPSWRGPEQNGRTPEAAVVTSWSPDGDNLLWKVPIGGRTTPIVMGSRVFLITPVGEAMGLQERVVCLQADTGKTLWEHRFNVFHTDIVENRVGWTALVGDLQTGNVYAHGTGGEFFCFSRDGKLIWKRSMSEEFGRISGYGGRLHTPIILKDLVIVSFMSSSWGSHARPLHRYVAFDKRTGEVAWWQAPGGRPLDTTYSCPITTAVGGIPMIIGGNADGNVYAMPVWGGEPHWKFRLSKRGLNTSVVVNDFRAYFSHSEENLDTTEMGAVVCVDASKRGDLTDSAVLWRRNGMTVGYSSPAIADGRLYVVDNSANLYALNAESGETYWEYNLGRVGKGSPVVTSDGVIYVTEQTGIFHILRDDGDKCVSLDREKFVREDGLVDEIYGSPAVADGRVYFQTRYNTYCLGMKGKAAARDPAPPTRSADRLYTSFLDLRPAEVTVQPGKSIQFTLTINGRTWDQPRGRARPEWEIHGPNGTINENGLFTAASVNDFSAGTVSVKIGSGAKRSARVRISPSLPIREDFEGIELGTVPPGWVGVVGKTKVVERDGGRVLKKLAVKPSPPFMRIRGYATPPIEGGYTVEAEMLGTPKGKRFRPDMGLINSRYRIIMMGMAKTLRIESWSPIPRFRHDVQFKWETNAWYHVKFQVRLTDDGALIRGKIWARGENEPDTWSIEAKDSHPNREGSAGIYAYSIGTTTKSKGPEVFFDNFQVTRND